MLKGEYLELIQLTGIHLLKQMPRVSLTSVKPKPLPPPHLKVPAQAPKPVAVPEPLPEAPSSEILDLLKTHCPKLNLIDIPEEKKQVSLLFENEEDKDLLHALQKALQKLEHTAKVLHVSEITEVDIQNCHCLLIGHRTTFLNSPLLKTHARKNGSGKAFIGKAKVVLIPPLSDPSIKKAFWNEILTRLEET